MVTGRGGGDVFASSIPEPTFKSAPTPASIHNLEGAVILCPYPCPRRVLGTRTEIRFIKDKNKEEDGRECITFV